MERGRSNRLEETVIRDELNPGSDNAPAWNACYRAGDTPWDQGLPSPGLLDYLAEHPIHGQVFVPGCGRGHDVRALAAQGISVTGLDVSSEAIQLAASFDLVGDEQYVVGDLFSLPPDLQQSFDWVWEHTCFCAIHPEQREDWVDAVYEALKPEGKVLGIFFIAPESDSSGPPFKMQPDALKTILERRFIIESEWEPERFYPGREAAECMMILSKRP